MEKIIAQIEQLRQEATHAFTTSSSPDQLETARITFLGRKGKIADCMPLLAHLSLEEKRVVGPLMNKIKEDIEELFKQRKEFFVEQAFAEKEELFKDFDVTAYKKRTVEGSLHPYTHVQKSIVTFFTSLGFQVADGPEAETEFYNFEALNIPETHPARDMQDTFWLDVPGMVMRTHTSNVQVHSMQKYTPPIAMISLGRVYRHEATDASHDCMFQQFEGMLIDKNVSLANVIATMKLFLQTFLGNKNLTLRVRPGFFPFVEPGIEIDASCPFCTKGCSTCKHSGWIEMVGAGLIHPHVLKAGGIDPEEYTGFAFGFGLTRLVMLKYGISDIRLLHSSSVEFLKQF